MRKDKNNITLSLQNIISFLKILTTHFAGAQKIITLCLIILMLSFINIILNSFVSNSSNSVSALSYESEIGIGFTFNPTLSINISSSDLVISNLIPGSSSDSNIINVSVLTNASHGYTLAIDTNNENLVHNDNNVNSIFSSIATNASLESLTTDNTWGYSYKLSSNNTWSNYNGLPLHTNTSTTIINTDNQVSKPIDFKIGAKASSTQASGTYTGTINFIAVSKPTPRTIDDIVYMQTFGELNPTDLQSVKNSMTQNHAYTLKDARDEQEYTVAKLNDNKIWMTKNLNLAGGTEITSELSDIPENYTLPTENGFQESNRLPASSQEGFSDDTQAYIYNSSNNTNSCSRPGCYSYYSWVAATAGSGKDIITIDIDAPYSICPKGWRLPTSRSTVIGNSDFYQLAVAYGMNSSAVSQSTPAFYNNAGPNTIPNFLLGGKYENNSFDLGLQYGTYYSSTSYQSPKKDYSFVLTFNQSNIYTSGGNYRKAGRSVRCLAR